MAGRGTARRVKDGARTRRLDELEPPEAPTGVLPEPAPAPSADAPPVEPGPPATGVAPRAPVDLEGSRDDLEERQRRWFLFREEWMRRKQAPPGGTAPPS
jgi:hypothetical protein